MLNPSLDNHAEGPLGNVLYLGRYVYASSYLVRLLTSYHSPYTRATYRYTPLLAVLLAPNAWLHPSFGKFLFAGCDIRAGVLMFRLLVSVMLPRTTSTTANEKSSRDSFAEEKDKDEAVRRQATFLVCLHLFSPLVFTISTRGSSESVLYLFVLSTLYFALKGRWDVAAVLLGLSTHWKIYPLVYGVACLGRNRRATKCGRRMDRIRAVCSECTYNEVRARERDDLPGFRCSYVRHVRRSFSHLNDLVGFDLYGRFVRR